MDSYQVKPHLSDEEVSSNLKKTKDAKESLRWQALYLVQVKKLKIKEISTLISMSEKTVYSWRYKYNQSGPSALKIKVRSSRPGALMTLEEEAAFLKEIEEEAAQGLIITAKTVKLKAALKLERSVSAVIGGISQLIKNIGGFGDHVMSGGIARADAKANINQFSHNLKLQIFKLGKTACAGDHFFYPVGVQRGENIFPLLDIA